MSDYEDELKDENAALKARVTELEDETDAWRRKYPFDHMPDCNGEGHRPDQCQELYREGIAGLRRIAEMGGGLSEAKA